MRILAVDIETSPIITYSWGLNDQNLSLDQLKEDWFIMAVCAKFVGEDKVYYYDLRNEKYGQDKNIVKKISKLINSCDVLLTQNGKNFDLKKINARCLINGLRPIKEVRHIDTYQIAKSKFGFTSNKLAYMTEKLCNTFKKSEHKKFPGLSLWKECLAGNKKAWNEMEKYNKLDVLSLEELYNKLKPWDNSINFNVFNDDLVNLCSCGSSNFKRSGYRYTNTSKFQRYECLDCGKWSSGKINLLDKVKRRFLRSKG